MNPLKSLFTALFLCTFALETQSQTNASHIWNFKSGTNFSGDYVSSGTTAVVVRSHGSNYICKLADLSTNDLLYAYQCKFAQRRLQLDSELSVWRSKGWIEVDTKLIENFPEKVNYKIGWMDCKFGELYNGNVDFSDLEVGFTIYDKNGDSFSKCKLPKSTYLSQSDRDQNIERPNPQIDVLMGLKRGDKIRLLGMASEPLNSSQSEFLVQEIRIIETAQESDVIQHLKDSLSEN